MSDSNITKNALAESMKKLMEERPFEKISVSVICNDCGINRKSFYYHFRDKYDLVNWIFYVNFVEEMDLNSYETAFDWFEDICEFFYKEKAFYRSALRIEGQNSFRDYLMETIRPIMQFFLADILPHNADDELFISFVVDTLLFSMVRWLSNGYEQEMDAATYSTKIREIITKISQIS